MKARILSLCRIISLGVAATFLAAAAASPQVSAPDVGLITQLSGAATYWNKEEQKNLGPAKAFTKVRQGDNFKLNEAGSLTLLYFASGRQETWKGPATFVAGATESAVAGDQKSSAQPEVKLIAIKASKQLAETPSPPRSSNSKYGGVQTMTSASLAPAGTPPPLSAEAQRKIKEAEGIYQDLSKSATASDLTPELYLLSVLGKYGQYAEMDKLVDTMLRKKPGDEALKDLLALVQSKSGKGLPATPGYAARKGPRATAAEEMPTAGQKPEAGEVKGAPMPKVSQAAPSPPRPGQVKVVAKQVQPMKGLVKTSFTKAKDSVITDNTTGLEWYVGPDRDITWNQAKSWTESLTAAGGGWRMPTTLELKTLYQEGAGRNNRDPIFQTTGIWVWSGKLRDASSARCFYFNAGLERWRNLNYASDGRAFAVRSRR